MLIRWLDRLFDDSLTRLVLLFLVAVGDLGLLHRPVGVWALVVALGGLAVCLAGWVVPTAAATVLPAVLLFSDFTGADVGVPLKVMMAVSLFELALRGSPRRVLAGAGVAAVLLGWHALSGGPVNVGGGLFRVVVVVGVPLLLGGYVRQIRNNAREAARRAVELARLRRSEVLAARAAERTGIARELHDLVAHHVSSMVLRAGVARHVLAEADPRVVDVLDDLHGSGAAALADLRRLVAVLRDPAQVGTTTGLVDPADLPEVLRDTIERGRRTGLTVHAEIDAGIGRLDAVRALAVLRLVQEGLANVAKHAGPAAEVTLSVELDGDTTRLEIVDDGGGRDAGPPGPTGHGLIGMSERVSLLNGRLEADRAGRGWRLYAELPALTGTAPEMVS